MTQLIEVSEDLRGKKKVCKDFYMNWWSLRQTKPYLKASVIPDNFSWDNHRKNKTFIDVFPTSIYKRMSVHVRRKPNNAQQCQGLIQTGGGRMIVLWQHEIYNLKEIRPCSMTEIIQNTGAQTKEILYKRLSQRFDPLGVGCGYIFTSTSSRCSILFMHFQTLHCE